MTDKARWWIDTDPGVDDAWAILMMFGAPQVRVEGISVVGGNVGIEHTLTNTCRIVDRAPYALPVFAGAARPLIGGLPDAGFVHGSDGMGEASLSAPKTTAQPGFAANALIEASKRDPGNLNVLALGPLTNLAVALMLDPDLPQRCGRLVIMGGAIGARGNTRVPSAEFNIAFDPEAAAIVFERWPGIELLDWELTLEIAPSLQEVEDWLSLPSECAAWMHSITRSTADFVRSLGVEGWAWADPLAAFAAIDPKGVTEWSEAPVEIALATGPTRGQTVIDWHGIGGFAGPKVRIARKVDKDRFHLAMRAVL